MVLAGCWEHHSGNLHPRQGMALAIYGQSYQKWENSGALPLPQWTHVTPIPASAFSLPLQGLWAELGILCWKRNQGLP